MATTEEIKEAADLLWGFSPDQVDAFNASWKSGDHSIEDKEVLRALELVPNFTDPETGQLNRLLQEKSAAIAG
jgi:hypothetical protein